MVSGSAIRYTITGLAVAAAIAASGPAIAQNIDSTTTGPKAQAVEVGVYPNFSNYGVQGNPGMLFQLGEWAYVGASRYPDGLKGADLMVSKKVGEGAVVAPFASTSTSGPNSGTIGATISMQAGKNLLVGANAAATSGTDGKTKTSGSLGAVGVFTGNGYMVRAGAALDLITNSMSWSAEYRRAILGFEGTVSGKVAVDSGKVTGKGIGIQVKKGPVLLSAGRGGPGWRDMTLHGRIKTGNMILDIQASGRGKGAITKPGYVGVGVTRVF